jgi:hypothetical protein
MSGKRRNRGNAAGQSGRRPERASGGSGKGNRRIGAQSRKLLGKHYANKYGVRKG